MATFYGSIAYGNGTAQYRAEMELTQSSTRAGTIKIYWVAVKDVVGGYSFSQQNSLNITLNGSTFYTTGNVGTVQCQTTGTRTLVYSGNWSVASTVNQASFVATFSQKQDTRYTSTVNGSLTFVGTEPVGHLDEVTPTMVKGWCALAGSDTRYTVSVNVFNAADPNWPLILPYIYGTADVYREDLKTAGYGDGKHGYEIPIDFAVAYGPGTYGIQVYAIYNSGNSTKQLTGTLTIEIKDRICVWDGSTWKSGTPYVYNGSAWKTGNTAKVYNGSAWK